MGKGGLLFSLLGLFISTSYGLVYDVFLKEGKSIFNLHTDGESKVLQETRLGEKLPLFKTFKVELKGGKIVLRWQAADQKVEKILIITDGGLFEETAQRVVEIKKSLCGREIKVYPVGRDGKIGLPAEVKLYNDSSL